MHKFLVVAMLVLAVGCSNDEPPDFIKQNNEPPKHKTAASTSGKKTQPAAGKRSSIYEVSLSIEPSTATKNTVLKAKAMGFSIKDAQIEWLLNGVPTATPRLEFFDSPELGIIKGDNIQAKAVVDGSEVLSNIVPIVNAKPVIEHVDFVVPNTLEAESLLSVDATVKDEDDDPVTLEYKWTKNGEPAGEGQSIQMGLKRGDEFGVTIVPFDGDEYGEARTIERTVGNFPPKIAQEYALTYENGVYKYQVQAEDPDGDQLTYLLKSGPEGMVINSQSGEVTWKAPEDYVGTAPFVVAATDGHGGETQMEMSLVVEGNTPPATSK